MASLGVSRKKKTRAASRRVTRKLSPEEYLKRSRRWLKQYDVEFRELHKTTERQRQELREMQEWWEAFQEELNSMPPFMSKNIPL